MSIKEFIEKDLVHVDIDALHKYFSNKNILVTGAAGSVGSIICEELINFNPASIIAFDIDDTRLYELSLKIDRKELIPYLGNITDIYSLSHLMHKYPIDVIIHSAALKHVPLLEHNPIMALNVNVFGTKNILNMMTANTNIQQLIHISTDKAVGPISILGVTKYINELDCLEYAVAHNKKVMSVRFGNIYGSRGSVVPIFENQIKNKKDLTITDIKMNRYFIKPKDAVLLTLQSCLYNKPGGNMYTFDMGEPFYIIDIAKYLIKKHNLILGKDININIVGNRSGEKLSEKLTDIDEYTKETPHNKIWEIGGHVKIDLSPLNELLEKSTKYVPDLDNIICNLIKDRKQHEKNRTKN